MLDSSRTDSPIVNVFHDYETLSRAATEQFISNAKEVFAEPGPFSVALAGGSTPRRLYELLTGPYRGQIQWQRIHLFWGDERYVPPNHADSNYRTAHEAFIKHVPIPPDYVHRMPTESGSPEEDAAKYESTLQQFFGARGGDHTFDLVLLGIGEDGHTASLFPENAPFNTDLDGPWVQAVDAPPRHTCKQRITLTPSVINNARDVMFIASGESKRDALHSVLDDPDSPLPAAQIRPQRNLMWFLDDAAYEESPE